MKDRGNVRYKKLEYKMAMGQYHRALLYLKAIDASQKNPADLMLGQCSSVPLSPELRHDVDRMYADCQSNLAGNACNLIYYIFLLSDATAKFHCTCELVKSTLLHAYYKFSLYICNKEKHGTSRLPHASKYSINRAS